MNLITVSISDFRDKLSDYLTLVSLGKGTISLTNAKSGEEVARIVGVKEKKETIEERLAELYSLAGFAAKFKDDSREKFAKMEKDYIKNLKKRRIL